MKIITISLLGIFIICSFSMAANIHGFMDAANNPEPINVTITTSEAVTDTAVSVYTPPSPQIYRNALGIEISMPGRIIPGISYSRYLSRDIFATIFGGLIADPDGTEVFASINGYKMINDFFYAGLGFSTIFDKGRSVLIGIANPSAGLMARITPEITFYVEATAWLFKVRTNSHIETLPDNTLLIFKAGVKYYFSWADPLPDINDMVK